MAKPFSDKNIYPTKQELKDAWRDLKRETKKAAQEIKKERS